jgi:hypothetical protein
VPRAPVRACYGPVVRLSFFRPRPCRTRRPRSGTSRPPRQSQARVWRPPRPFKGRRPAVEEWTARSSFWKAPARSSLSQPPPSTPSESRHDHRPLGQPLVPRQSSIEPLLRRSTARGGHRRRPSVRRSPSTSLGQATPEIEPSEAGDPCPTLSQPRAWASSPESGEPRRPPPPRGYIAR